MEDLAHLTYLLSNWCWLSLLDCWLSLLNCLLWLLSRWMLLRLVVCSLLSIRMLSIGRLLLWLAVCSLLWLLPIRRIVALLLLLTVGLLLLLLLRPGNWSFVHIDHREWEVGWYVSHCSQTAGRLATSVQSVFQLWRRLGILRSRHQQALLRQNLRILVENGRDLGFKGCIRVGTHKHRSLATKVVQGQQIIGTLLVELSLPVLDCALQTERAHVAQGCVSQITSSLQLVSKLNAQTWEVFTLCIRAYDCQCFLPVGALLHETPQLIGNDRTDNTEETLLGSFTGKIPHPSLLPKVVPAT